MSEGLLCQASRKNGEPCRVRALPGQTTCFAHSDATREKREAARTLGGKHRAARVRMLAALPPELGDLYERLVRLFDDVLTNRYPARTAEVAVQVARATLDFARLAHELGEAAELKQRLDELESRIGARTRRAR